MNELSDEKIERMAFEISEKLKCLEWSKMNNFADGMKYMRDYFKNSERHNLQVVRNEYDAASEQPKPHGTGKEIIGLVVSDLIARSELGEKRYGEKLKSYNGRNALLDAYQEALDLCMYLRQEIDERAAK